MSFMKEYAKRETVTTENGALGFKTTGHYLLDFSYSVPAMRNNPESFFELFDKSMVPPIYLAEAASQTGY